MKYVSIYIVTILVAFLYAPISSHAQFGDTPKEYSLSETISIETANGFLEQCLSDFPKKFTPTAHEHYCKCAAANLRIKMTNSDLSSLNNSKKKKTENPAFKKYIQNVTTPCMSIAVDTLAYVGCLEHRGHSPYITNILPYCRCVGAFMSNYTKKTGSSIILTNMTNNPKFYDDPLQTLMIANEYNIARNQAYQICRPQGLERTRKR